MIAAIFSPSVFERGVGLRPRRNTVLGAFVRPLSVGELLALRPLADRSVELGTLPCALSSPTASRSSQMSCRRPAYLRLTAPHATFFHSPQGLFTALDSLQVRSFTAHPKLLSKSVQCYHQIVFPCVPSFLHFACSETSLLKPPDSVF